MDDISHLGGHNNVTHIDEPVLNYFIQKYNIQSFLDIGCGPGGMVKLAANKGLYSFGIDGDPNIEEFPNLIRHDYTKSNFLFSSRFNLGWSVEFLEHVEEKYMDNYMRTFLQCDRIVITHALPGETGGHHHVNLQTPEYWKKKFIEYGFWLDENTTNKIRNISEMRKGFMKKTGMCFCQL